MSTDHEHDWVLLHDALTGVPSALRVCRVPGCTWVQAATPEAAAELDRLAAEAEAGYDLGGAR